MVSDKLYQTLDCDVASYICIKQGENWLKLSDLAKECDIFSVNKGKTSNETHPFTREKIIENRGKNNNFFKESEERKISFKPKERKIVCFICGDEDFSRVCPKQIGISNP